MRRRLRKRALMEMFLLFPVECETFVRERWLSIGVSRLFPTNRICVDCLSPQPFFANRSGSKKEKKIDSVFAKNVTKEKNACVLKFVYL